MLGGMIKYILDNTLYDLEYITGYTNASFIVKKSYDFKNGLFSGYDPETRSYDKSQWGFETDTDGNPKKNLELKHPRCVFNLLKKHFSRYNTHLVCRISGTPEPDLLEIYKTYGATGARDKAGTIMYAMGWTQHTVGVQNIRTMAIIQLLLGNMGIAGGGINALRGEANVQGSTDHGLLWDTLPGYLKTPLSSDTSLTAYNQQRTPKSNDPLSANWWRNYPKYSVSFLKSMFGDKATKTNDFGYGWMPKVDDGQVYSWIDLFDRMDRGKIRGFFAWGQNPACSGADSSKTRKAMGNLDWMVNVNLFDNETGAFWRGPGMNPSTIKTEVFMLPACVSVEKEGSITNSSRWVQWRYRGPRPLGKSRPDGDIIIELGNRIKELYKKDGGTFPEPILNLKWDYTTHDEFDPHKVAKEINGYFQKDIEVKGKKFKKGMLVPSFVYLQDDGSTSSGNWLYGGSYTEKGNMTARQGHKDTENNIGLYPEFAWSFGRSIAESSTIGLQLT